MAAPTTIKVTELEFDQIKANLKTFLSSKDEFKDFDFEASGISFLLDILSYNTHYNAVMANFVANEMFLDTAAKRSNVISHAKSLGYKTRGVRSSRAKVNLTINTLTLANGAVAPDTFVLPRGTPFITTVGNTQFQFVTLTDVSAPKNLDNTYTFTNIELIEGVFFTYEYVVTDASVGVLYPIPNQKVDTSSMSMYVRNSVSDLTTTQWQNSNTILGIDSTSKVFFTQEGKNEYYEFYFGNGVIGVLPALGNLITIEYVSSQGYASNGARKFVPVGKLTHTNNPNITAASYRITLVQPSVGGADAESIAEIKHNASNHFIVQDRAVTVDDYKAIIEANFANIRSIKVWGGDEAVPVKYGKVIACIQPQYGDVLTISEKDYLTALVKSKSVVTVGLEFDDPEYLNIVVSSVVYYDPTVLPKSMNLQTVVQDAISNYSLLELEKFSAHFRFSKFVSAIDSAQESISSNNTSVTVYKSITPKINTADTYTINFLNKIANGTDTVSSTLFKMAGSSDWVRLSNVGTDLYAIYTNELGKSIQVANLGTVDLTTGIVRLSSIEFSEIYGAELQVSIKPVFNDISAGLNNILRIQAGDISIKTVAELPNRARTLV